MRYIEILNGVMCSTDIDSCCSDYGIAKYIYAIKKAIEIIHFAVPIILIIMTAVQLFKMVISPDDQQGKKTKSLLNKILAAVLIFFIPFIVDLAMKILPNSFSVVSCWKSAEEMAEQMDYLEDIGYDPFDDNRTGQIGDNYESVTDQNTYIPEVDENLETSDSSSENYNE